MSKRNGLRTSFFEKTVNIFWFRIAKNILEITYYIKLDLGRAETNRSLF